MLFCCFVFCVLHLQDTPKTTAYPDAQGTSNLHISQPLCVWKPVTLTSFPAILPTHGGHSTELLHLSLEEQESESPRLISLSITADYRHPQHFFTCFSIEYTLMVLSRWLIQEGRRCYRRHQWAGGRYTAESRMAFAGCDRRIMWTRRNILISLPGSGIASPCATAGKFSLHISISKHLPTIKLTEHKNEGDALKPNWKARK